ncbi:MAG: TetR/AcrR family transcriptional regulator [Candidatus Thermoplasmatota archaeon]|nr:TetR/AcrR family transcriptional regulator [Candidatus Thermoplasmatota archaeon]
MNKINDKEEKILNASIKVFSKKGYDMATIDEIAKKARVSKGIVFFYFKKKDNLIEKAALRSVPVEEISGVNKRDHGSAQELLMDFGLSFLNKYENPELRNLLLMTIANKEKHKQIELALREMCFHEMNKMFSKLEELAGTGVPAPVRRAFFGALLCYVVWWNDNELNPEEYVKTLTERIMDGIRVPT